MVQMKGVNSDFALLELPELMTLYLINLDMSSADGGPRNMLFESLTKKTPTIIDAAQHFLQSKEITSDAFGWPYKI